jgi:hypothetical protein
MVGVLFLGISTLTDIVLRRSRAQLLRQKKKGGSFGPAL